MLKQALFKAAMYQQVLTACNRADSIMIGHNCKRNSDWLDKDVNLHNRMYGSV